jgi:hypothetical protein
VLSRLASILVALLVTAHLQEYCPTSLPEGFSLGARKCVTLMREAQPALYAHCQARNIGHRPPMLTIVAGLCLEVADVLGQRPPCLLIARRQPADKTCQRLGIQAIRGILLAARQARPTYTRG